MLSPTSLPNNKVVPGAPVGQVGFTGWRRNGKNWSRVSHDPNDDQVFTLVLMSTLRGLWEGTVCPTADLELVIVKGSGPPSVNGEDACVSRRMVLYARTGEASR